ncbi:MAG: hypothetical protein ACO3NK_14560, partial [Prochlorotrichaceae cyanobacterium]
DSPPITEAIQTATFRVQFTIVSSESETENESKQETERDLTLVKSWLTELLSRPSLAVELTSKSGKPHLVDLRARLQSLDWGGTSDRHLATHQPLDFPTVVLDYQGNYRNDGNLLRPEHLLLMLETIAQEQDPTLSLDLIHAHRLAIGL